MSEATNEFQRAISASALSPGEATEVEVGGREIAVINVGGQFYAIDNRCPHADGPLGEGMVQDEIIICPWHQWEFDVTTGEYLDDPTICVDRFETKVEDGEVFVRVSGT